MRAVIVATLASFLAGCTSAPKAPTDDTATRYAIEAARACADAEHSAREIAAMVRSVHDLDVLTALLRQKIGQQPAISDFEISQTKVDENWFYVGDGERWDFRSGDWLVRLDEPGVSTLHFDYFPEDGKSIRFDVVRNGGAYAISDGKIEEWIVRGWPISPVCEFSLPVPAND